MFMNYLISLYKTSKSKASKTLKPTRIILSHDILLSIKLTETHKYLKMKLLLSEINFHDILGSVKTVGKGCILKYFNSFAASRG